MCIRYTHRYENCHCKVELEAESFEYCREALFRHLGLIPKYSFNLRNAHIKKGVGKGVWKDRMVAKIELLSPEWHKRLGLYRHRCEEKDLKDKSIPDLGYFKDGWCGIHCPDPASRPVSGQTASRTAQEENSQGPDLLEGVSFASLLGLYSDSPSPSPPSMSRSATPTITLTSPPEDVHNMGSEFLPGVIGQAITTSDTITLLPEPSNPFLPPPIIAEEQQPYTRDIPERLRKSRSEQKLRRHYGSDVADAASIFPMKANSGIMRRPASSAWLSGS